MRFIGRSAKPQPELTPEQFNEVATAINQFGVSLREWLVGIGPMFRWLPRVRRRNAKIRARLVTWHKGNKRRVL